MAHAAKNKAIDAVNALHAANNAAAIAATAVAEADALAQAEIAFSGDAELSDGQERSKMTVTMAKHTAHSLVEVVPKKPLFLYVAFTAAHSPLQPMPGHIEKCAHIPHLWRRQYCGLVVGMDEGE